MIKYTRVRKSDGKLLDYGNLQEADRAMPKAVVDLLDDRAIKSVTLSLKSGEAVHYERF